MADIGSFGSMGDAMTDCTLHKSKRQMKASGVPWVDEIPKDWEVRNFRHEFSFSKGLAITKADLVEDGVPVISYGQIHSKLNTATHLSEALLRYVPRSAASVNPSARLNWGDFVFADTSEDVDGAGNFVPIELRSEMCYTLR